MDKGDRGALAALGMLLLAVVVVAFIAPGPRNPANGQIEQPNAASIEKRQPSDIAHPVAGAQEFHPWRDTYAQWLMALFSVAATGVSIWAVGLVRETLKATRKAIHLDNRPWLGFEISITSDFGRNDTDIFQEGLGVDIGVALTNYGRSPALAVRTVITEVMPRNWNIIGDFYLEKRRDEILASYAVRERRGQSVFPDEPVAIGERILVTDGALKDSPRMASIDGPKDDISLIAQYIVSVFYTSPTSDEMLETSAIYSLWMTYGKDHITQLVIAGGDRFKPIPKRKMRLQESGYKRAK